ncbi:MAG TPA: hypothetical protein VM389_01790 [Phycisphaerae bacterium]|nr:hypothetical protein [Phycisphaerae bacterium]
MVVVNISEDGYAEFRFFRPNASNVFVTGDFNDWRTDQLRMVRSDDGYWVLKVRLPAGDYRFRYIADGAWYTDYAAFGVEPGRFGMDSLLLVPDRVIRLQPQPQPQPQPQRRIAAA